MFIATKIDHLKRASYLPDVNDVGAMSFPMTENSLDGC